MQDEKKRSDLPFQSANKTEFCIIHYKIKYDENKYMIIGSFAIALGTLLITGLFKNRILVVLGVIINVLGLLEMTVGSVTSNKKDKSDIIGKISEFKNEIYTIKKLYS